MQRDPVLGYAARRMDAAPPAPDLPASTAAPVRAPDPSPQEGSSPAHPAARAQRTRAFRVAIDLCRARLAASRSGRFARGTSLAIAGFAFVIALSVRAADGPAAPVGGLLRKAAIALAWISGGLLTLAVAKDASASDRADGIEALVAARGIGASLLRVARTLGSMEHITRTIGFPLVAFGLATAALASDVPTAVRRVIAAAFLFVWAIVAGVTLGGLAALCARLFGARGPSALLTIVVGERILVGSLGLAAWSLPGALDAVLSLVLGATGVGGGH